MNLIFVNIEILMIQFLIISYPLISLLIICIKRKDKNLKFSFWQIKHLNFAKIHCQGKVFN